MWLNRDTSSEVNRKRNHKQAGPAPTDPFMKVYPIIQEKNEEGGFDYTVYIHDQVGDAHEFSEIIDLLGSCDEGDRVIFHLNTPGGYMHSLLMVRDAMRHSKALVLCECTGTVASAGTMMALSGKGLYIADHTTFMIHYYSGGVGGKGNEIVASVDFSKIKYPAVFRDVYQHFLTEEEITEVIAGHDMYMDAEEVRERWLRVIAVEEAVIQEKREMIEVVKNAQMIADLEDRGYRVTKARKKKAESKKK